MALCSLKSEVLEERKIIQKILLFSFSSQKVFSSHKQSPLIEDIGPIYFQKTNRLIFKRGNGDDCCFVVFTSRCCRCNDKGSPFCRKCQNIKISFLIKRKMIGMKLYLQQQFSIVFFCGQFNWAFELGNGSVVNLSAHYLRIYVVRYVGALRIFTLS